MANINKTNFIKTYGIDDDNFLAYLNKFGTLKKIVDMGRLEVISKEKLKHLYNRFIYYNSLGHTLDTIVEETTTDIRSLFFFNGDGYFEYILPPTNPSYLDEVLASVSVFGRICQVKLQFKTKIELDLNNIIFDLIPAPYSSFRDILFSPTNNTIPIYVTDEGIVLYRTTKIPANTFITGSFTYIIKK